MQYVFTNELITIGLDIGLFPAQHQIIVWTKSVQSQMNPMYKFHRRSIQNTKTFNMHFLENICHFVLVKSFWLIEWCNIIEISLKVWGTITNLFPNFNGTTVE